MAGRMQGKTVVVTGGASGMGRSIVERLVSEGANVTIADLNGAAAQEIAATLDAGEGAGRAIGVATDVSKRADVQAVIAQTVETFGQLDIIFNNAGFNKPLPLLEVTEENCTRSWT